MHPDGWVCLSAPVSFVIGWLARGALAAIQSRRQRRPF